MAVERQKSRILQDCIYVQQDYSVKQQCSLQVRSRSESRLEMRRSLPMQKCTECTWGMYQKRR